MVNQPANHKRTTSDKLIKKLKIMVNFKRQIKLKNLRDNILLRINF